MYKKHKIRRKKAILFALLKFFSILNILKKDERFLTMKTDDAAKMIISKLMDIQGMPVIKDIWRRKEKSIKMVIIAYEKDSANVLPHKRKSTKAEVQKKKISVKRKPAIINLFSLLFQPFSLSNDLLSLS